MKFRDNSPANKNNTSPKQTCKFLLKVPDCFLDLFGSVLRQNQTVSLFTHFCPKRIFSSEAKQMRVLTIYITVGPIFSSALGATVTPVSFGPVTKSCQDDGLWSCSLNFKPGTCLKLLSILKQTHTPTPPPTPTHAQRRKKYKLGGGERKEVGGEAEEEEES